METTFWLLIGLSIGALVVSLLARMSLSWVLRKRQVPAAELYPKVSILKPVKGNHPTLYGNLLAAANQDYPDFEVLIGIADGEDPAHAVARRVQAECAPGRVRIILGAPDIGLNPKVSNVHYMLQFTHSPWILISDADVHPGQTYLRESMDWALYKGASLVHHSLQGIAGKSFTSQLESFHMAGWVAPAIAAAEVCKHPCVIGKSMLLERDALEAVGGVHAFRNVLAEDYLIGSALHQKGYTVKMAPKALPVHLAKRSFSQIVNRYLRWAQMQRKINFSAFISEWLLCATPWAILGMFSAISIGSIEAALTIASLFVVRSMSDFLHASRDENAWTFFGPLWMPIRDTFALAMWFGACLSTTIDWKGRKMRILSGSRLSPLQSHSAVAEEVV